MGYKKPSYAKTDADNNFSTDQTINGDLDVTGTATATNLVTDNINSTGDILTLSTSGAFLTLDDGASEATFDGMLVVADGFSTVGGSSNQFLKADGSLDSNTYLTSASLSSYAKHNAVQSYSKAQYFETKYYSGTASGSIPVNLDDYQVMDIVLSGNATLANPTNKKHGLIYQICIKQDATGSRTLSYGTDYEFGDDGAPTLSTGANKMDMLSFFCDGSKMFFMGIKKGFDNYSPNTFM